MALRLDPQFPLLWRTPQSLQFGLDRPRAVLESVSPAEERLIAALVAGVSSSGMQMIGRSVGLDEPAIGALISALQPALEEKSPRPYPPSVMVIGAGKTAELVKQLLLQAGVTVLLKDCEEPPAIVVIVAHFVIEPEAHGKWLRRDIPHLGVVFGDEVVRIASIVRPGAGPCLYCLELHRTDSDPSWPAIASQLLNRRSGIETSLVAGEVAAIIARKVLARQVVRAGEPMTMLEIDVSTGDRQTRNWAFHPDCGCASLNP